MGKTIRKFEHRKDRTSLKKYVRKQQRNYIRQTVNNLIKSDDDLHGTETHEIVAHSYCCRDCDGFAIHPSMLRKMKYLKQFIKEEDVDDCNIMCNISNDGKGIVFDSVIYTLMNDKGNVTVN